MKCLITGSSGYVGGSLKNALKAAGHDVVELKRKASGTSDENWIPYSLEAKLNLSVLGGADALIHAAFDFRPLAWSDIERVNVRGSIELFEMAVSAGVSRIVFISSVSAFENCKSLYGRAKLEIEKAASEMGAVIIRPGLVHGDNSGGMVGRLEGIVAKAKVIPVVGASQKMFLCHEEDLAKLVLSGCAGQCPSGVPILGASETQLTFKQILKQLGERTGRRPIFIPVPSQAVWLALKALEIAGRPLAMRSDSLISLLNSNPAPDFAPTRACARGSEIRGRIRVQQTDKAITSHSERSTGYLECL